MNNTTTNIIINAAWWGLPNQLSHQNSSKVKNKKSSISKSSFSRKSDYDIKIIVIVIHSLYPEKDNIPNSLNIPHISKSLSNLIMILDS